MTKYYFFVGEASGDLHGSLLLKALKKNPTHTFYGVGGPLMRKEGFCDFLPMENFQVMGFSDVIKSLPSLVKYFYMVKKSILAENPDCVILIDYPGFNLRMAKALRKKGYSGKIIQYVAPSVWAHGKHRIHTMAKTLDLLLTLYPFEPNYFRETSLKAEFIGNPILDRIKTYFYREHWKKELGIPQHRPLIALFPGSRRGEILRHFPYLLKGTLQFKKENPDCILALSINQEHFRPLFESMIQTSTLKIDEDIFLVPSSHSYELMRDSTLALAKSGTVTLELALHLTPTIVLYSLSRLNYLIANYILKLNLPHYCIVNILGNCRVFPEYIGLHLPPIATLLEEMTKLYRDPETRAQLIHNCEKIKNDLDRGNSIDVASQLIEGLFSC